MLSTKKGWETPPKSSRNSRKSLRGHLLPPLLLERGTGTVPKSLFSGLSKRFGESGKGMGRRAPCEKENLVLREQLVLLELGISFVSLNSIYVLCKIYCKSISQYNKYTFHLYFVPAPYLIIIQPNLTANLKCLSTASPVQVFPKFQPHLQNQPLLLLEPIHKAQNDTHNQCLQFRAPTMLIG